MFAVAPIPDLELGEVMELSESTAPTFSMGSGADGLHEVVKFLRQVVQVSMDAASAMPNREDLLQRLDDVIKEGASASVKQLQHLLRDSNEYMHSIQAHCSPQEIAQFRESLKDACGSHPELADQLRELQTRSFDSLQDAIKDAKVAMMELGDPSQLAQKSVSLVRNVQEEIKQAGRALVSALLAHEVGRNLSHSCKTALENMAQAAVPLSAAFVAELKVSRALFTVVQELSVAELVQLRTAIARAASSGVAMELMTLWGEVHTAVGGVLSEEAAAAVAKVSASAVDAASETTQRIGSLLALALSSSMALSSALSVELQEGIKQMMDKGAPLANHLMQELSSNLSQVVEALPKDKLLELQSQFSQTLASEWGDVQQFASQLHIAVSDLPDMPPEITVAASVITKTVVDEVYNSEFAAAIVNGGFGTLDKAFIQTRESVHDAILAIAQGMDASACLSFLAMLPPLLRFEILRDFCQTVSLFFTNLYGTFLEHKDSRFVQGVQQFFEMMYNIMAADFTALWGENRERLLDIGFVVLLVAIVLIYFAYLWFAFSGRHMHKRSEEIRHGHEALSWAEIAAKQRTRLKLFTFVITACLSVYLPMTRVSIEVLVAAVVQDPNISSSNSTLDASSSTLSPSTLTIIQRYKGMGLWPVLVAGAGLMLLTFTLPLPFFLVRAISENRPTGSAENALVTYDIDGEQVPFDDKVYTQLVTKDASQLRCPYRSLYAGFEMRWSHYKVYQLLFKVALTLPLILTPQIGVRGLVASTIYVGIVAFTSYGTPFSDPLNNVMEISGKVAALATCIGGVLVVYLESENLQVAVGFAINIINTINLVLMLIILLLGMKSTRIGLKNMLGTLTFSDTSRNLLDAPAHAIIPQWDLDKEVKHRVWQHFWHTLLLTIPDNAELVQRLMELQQAATESGVHNIRAHWHGEADAYVSEMRLAARCLLEGVDVYWADASGTRDGKLDSESCFGKMYIHAYPFHCVMVYDDAKDESIIRDDKFAAFFLGNFTADVLRKREVRHKLRALSASGQLLHHPFSREEHVTVEDGTETYTVKNGDGSESTRTRTRHTSVKFTCYYTNGRLKVAGNTKHPMADGFTVTMEYNDGYGDAVAPHTGKVHHQKDRAAVMGANHIGLTPTMEESETMAMLFHQVPAVCQDGVAQLRQQHRAYRDKLMEEHRTANQVLSDGFWFFVFNDAHLPRQALERYLREQETNHVLRQLTTTHSDALAFLYKRMGFVQAHDACKLWYVFWDDVFARNGEMKRLKPHSTELNPAHATSIAYRVLKRCELENWLRSRKLLGRPFSWQTILLRRRCLFHEGQLQLLYTRMESLAEPGTVMLKPAAPLSV